MRQETKKYFKNFTVDIIDFFLSIPESILAGFDRKEFYVRLQGRFPEKELTCSNIAKVISNLKKRGYVELSERGKSISFTNKARLAVIDKSVLRLPEDNKFCFVSFDIPEAAADRRNKFRRVIKRMGFRQVQKSLWVHNKNVGQFVELAAKEYDVEQYIVYLISEKTNIDSIIPELLSK